MFTIAEIWLQTGWACGAMSSHYLSPPHSSDSKWLKPILRNLAGSTTWATASPSAASLFGTSLGFSRVLHIVVRSTRRQRGPAIESLADGGLRDSQNDARLRTFFYGGSYVQIDFFHCANFLPAAFRDLR
jgi:hypothetical protein